MKKVLFDHQTFSLQDRGGISRYFYELHKHLCNDSEISTSIGLKYSQNIYLRGSTGLIDTGVHSGGIPAKSTFVRVILNHMYCLQLMRTKKFQIFHPTYYIPYFLLGLAEKPFVLTVFDMIHELIPSEFKSMDRTKIYKSLLIFKADKILTISEQTKKDIVKIYHIDPKRITVIGLGTSLQKRSYGKGEHYPSKYVLYVGRRGGYKNFTILLSAMALLQKEYTDLYLLNVGGEDFKRSEVLEIQRLGMEKKVKQIFVNDDCLADLYYNAQALVVPSLYEGFGLPVVEAMSLRCPMVLSDIPVFHEVAGDTANYFDPHEPHSLVIAIKEILTKHEKRKWLVNKALERSEYYQWKKTAEETKDLYLSVINDKIKK